MTRQIPVHPYPWARLPRCDGAALAALDGAARALRRAIDPAALERTLSELLGVACRCGLHVAEAASAPPTLPAVRVSLRSADGRWGCLLGLDPGLVTDAIVRMLGRPPALDDPHAPVDPVLEGAADALALEVARRLSASAAVATELGALPPSGSGVTLRATLHLGDRAYPVGAFVRWYDAPPPALERVPLVARLGTLPLTLPLVVGISVGSWRELSELERGDAWSCGGGLWIDRTGAGRAVLAAPTAAGGPEVTLASDGEVVLLGGFRALALDVEEVEVEDGMRDVDDTLTEAIFDAPVVVRIELGAVAMPAREWVELRPGDVIRTDRRIAAPAILRVAGRQVATGELVEVDGDVAVRILTLAPAGGGA